MRICRVLWLAIASLTGLASYSRSAVIETPSAARAAPAPLPGLGSPAPLNPATVSETPVPPPQNAGVLLNEALLRVANSAPGHHEPIEPIVQAAVAQSPGLTTSGAARFFAPILSRASAERHHFERLKKTVAAQTKEWGLPVEDLLRDSDVLLLGENHSSPSSLQTLTKHLPRLKAAGVTVIGLEDSMTDQALLDSHQALNISKRAHAYNALYWAAKEQGIRILNLDVPNELLIRRAARQAAERTGRPINDFPTDLDSTLSKAGNGYEPGFNEAVAEAVFDFRESIWADRLADALQHGGKAVVLSGDGHLPHPPGTGDFFPQNTYWMGPRLSDLAKRLATWSLRTFSVSLIGGSFLANAAGSGDRLGRYFLYRLTDAIREKDTAFFRTSATTGVFHMGEPPTQP